MRDRDFGWWPRVLLFRYGCGTRRWKGAAMTEDILYRPATMNDITPAYAVFRRSIFDYLFRLGMVDEATAKDPPIEASWKRLSTWMEHLWRSAAENWVAVDAAGCVVG